MSVGITNIIIIKKKKHRAGDMTLLVRGLPNEHEDLSSDP